MSGPLFIAVTPDTHAKFTAQQDELGLGSDAFVLELLEDADRLRRIAAIARANGDGAIGASFVAELATV